LCWLNVPPRECAIVRHAPREKDSTMSERLDAADVCTRHVVVGYPSMSVSEAARLMREQHVGCLVIVEESRAGAVPAGLLTDRDIVTAVVAKELDPPTLRVGDVMTTDLLTAREGDSVVDLITLMHRKGVRRVPITAANGTLVGLVAMDDLLVVLARQFGELVQTIGGEHKREQGMRP
jgi:CBS domain-containing protein